MTHCECGAKLPKMKHVIRYQEGNIIMRKRVCLSCWHDHMEKSE